MLEPSAVIIYVSNVATSSSFYQDLLEINPEELSPAFSAFKMQNGVTIGLKDRETVEPAAEGNGGFELAITVSTNEQVDALFGQWKQRGIPVAQIPITLDYGYTFVALDPDNNRIRVVALEK
ncbi:VOC family protein [Legionella genomosp. 1]|uniref:VOC family protein n=1 Tax=Legionella genomosp. 1 TaxID=1093625 RepID=UPI001054CD2C|nr:VOC family protein [Legionella genomosp. 1]